MAVTKQAYASAVAPWTITAVCNDLRDAFIGAGLMTAWFDSFTSGGREHRVLEVIYDAAKAYGKTYYWFTFDGTGIWVRIVSGWNAASDVPAGTARVDFYDNVTTANNGAAQLLTVSTSISFSCTRYTSSGRSFFVLRAGTAFFTFTIDPAGTAFRSLYDLALGYHEGLFEVTVPVNSYLVGFSCINRSRRALLLGSSLNNSTVESQYRQSIRVSGYNLPRNHGAEAQAFFPVSGFVMPGWTTAANPSAGSNFNPVFTGLRLSSIHAADLPSDFGVSSIKVSNTLAIQDNATVSAGIEEYEILNFINEGFINSIASNPIFLARTVG
jgi:hypothetical protein